MANLSTNILDDFKEEEFQYDLADRYLRFANYVLDRIVAQTIAVVPAYFAVYSESDLAKDYFVPLIVLAFILLPTYYILCEHFLKGRTLAKFLTETKVVRYDGSRPSFMTIVGRSLARYIPLEPFSIFTGLPHAWHDSLSKTMVIRY